MLILAEILESNTFEIGHRLVKTLRQIIESFRFATNALKVNLLRTTLSLLGVTIGIFAIIAVFTVVDSLERSIKDSFSFLGANILYVEKWPYGLGGEYPWWKYMKRPPVDVSEFEFLNEHVTYMKSSTIYATRGGSLIKYENSSINNVSLCGATYGYNDVFDLDIVQGRFFTQQEADGARNVAVIGADIVAALFPLTDPIGKEIKIRGLKYVVIGTIKKEGESMLGFSSNDKACYVPYKSFQKLYYTGGMFGINPSIAIKGLEEDAGLAELESQVTGLMRAKRGLKPLEEDSFALNRPESITNFLTEIFKVISLAGWVIGGFSILVGGFGIANIMFVSVKERTNLIGIQKSIGAKNYFILLQFLFESVFLSVIGGGVGIFLVYLLTFIPLGTFVIVLTAKNILIGLGVASIVGTVAGIVPAAIASKMDPVTAIRTS